MDRRSLLAAGAAALISPLTHAQARFPSRSITIYGALPAAGVMDQHLRALAERAQKTLGQAIVIEAKPGAGATLTGGRVALTVVESGQQDEALRAWDTLRAAGYAARIRPEPGADGSMVYRVRIEQLASRAEAAGLARRIAKLPGITPPAP